MPKKSEHSELLKRLDYRFQNAAYLEESLRHRSYVNEQPGESLRDNECLEFLGDAVLNLVVGHLLMEHYPNIREGDLSRMRANLVNETQLAAIAREMELGSYILLGKGEIQTNGRNKNSILADTFEALLAAVYLDGGFRAAFDVVKRRFSSLIDSMKTPLSHQDYKSYLQEVVQLKERVIPQYKVIGEEGPDHNKTFSIELNVCGISTRGVGKSKKLAEQDAARKALNLLESNDSG